MEPEFNPGNPRFGAYPIRDDMENMSDTPKRAAHRRARSDTFFRLTDDDMLFNADADADPDDDFSLFQFDLQLLNMSEPESNSAISAAVPAKSDDSKNVPAAEKPKIPAAGSSHFRSLSVDAAFFDRLGFQNPGEGAGEAEKANRRGDSEKRTHRHTNSMDGSSSSFEVDSSMDFAKKAMTSDKLAELALIDPKRAKRILANRQSAARSKERKIRYTSELERKVQTLQTEATTLSAQLTLLQRDTTGLTSENKELKLRLQAMEQEAHLRDALNDALREEVQRLKIATGQSQNSFNRGIQQSASPFFSQSQPLNQFSGHQNQQRHTAQTSPNGQPIRGQSPNCSMDYIRGSNNLR